METSGFSTWTDPPGGVPHQEGDLQELTRPDLSPERRMLLVQRAREMVKTGSSKGGGLLGGGGNRSRLLLLAVGGSGDVVAFEQPPQLRAVHAERPGRGGHVASVLPQRLLDARPLVRVEWLRP